MRIYEGTWENEGRRIEQFAVLGLDLPPSAEVDGLLGMDFLTKVGAVVDVEKREIRVREITG